MENKHIILKKLEKSIEKKNAKIEVLSVLLREIKKAKTKKTSQKKRSSLL